MRIATIIVIVGMFAAPTICQTVGVPGVNDFRVALDGGSLTGAGQPSCVNVTFPAGPHCMRLNVTAAPGSCLVLLAGDGCAPGLIPVGPTCSIDISNPTIAFACWQFPAGSGLFVVPPQWHLGGDDLLRSSRGLPHLPADGRD